MDPLAARSEVAPPKRHVLHEQRIEEFYERLKAAHVFLSSAIEEGIPLGLVEATCLGVVGVVCRVPWAEGILCASVVSEQQATRVTPGPSCDPKDRKATGLGDRDGPGSPRGAADPCGCAVRARPAAWYMSAIAPRTAPGLAGALDLSTRCGGLGPARASPAPSPDDAEVLDAADTAPCRP